MSRWLGPFVRVVLFGALVSYLYSVKFAPYRDQPFDGVEQAVLAVNAGYPFRLLYPAADGQPPVMAKMSEVYGDYGVHLFVAAAGGAGQLLFGPSFQVSSSTARTLLFLFFIVTVAVMLMPAVPLPVGIAGVLSLWALFKWGTVALRNAQLWGVTYVAVVGAVYIGTVLKPWTRSRVAVLCGLAALAGYAQLLRQEAGPTPYVAGFALLGSAIAAWIAGRGPVRSMPETSELRSVARRAAAGGLLLVLANAAVLPLERLCFSLAWGTPYAETSIAAHGSGWPLYLSLGYVSNPYNIGWRDPIGELHSRLINPAITVTSGPLFQATLLREFEQIVISRPWLFIDNVRAKAARVHQLANEPSGASTGTLMTQPPALVLFYRAVPWVLAVSLILLAWRGTAEAVAAWFGLVALAAAASAGPVVVFPEYLGGLQGAIVSLTLVVPAVTIGSLVEAARRRDYISARPARRLLAVYGSAIAAGAVLAAGFVAVQAWRYRNLQAQFVASEPLDALRTQQFRYAHVFNDLPVARQGRIIAQLEASKDESVARQIDERRGDFNLFAPQALIRTASEIHLFAWMGRGFVPPVPRLFQGSTHVSLLICGGCPSETSVNDIQLPIRWMMINDLEWQGRYRMFTVQSSPALNAAAFFRVAAERARALDTKLPTWIVPELISTARLTF